MLKWLLLVVSSSAIAGLVDGQGTIIVLDGQAETLIGEKATPASIGTVFKDGSGIRTGEKSKAELFLSNGIRLVMLPTSTINVKNLKQGDGSLIAPPADNKPVKETSQSFTDLEVVSGKVIGDVKKLASGSTFTLKTPVGVVNIKGTVFSVEYRVNKDGTQSFNVGCLVGRVTVQMADPRVAPVSIPAGKQMSITAPPVKAVTEMPPPPPDKKEGNKDDKKEGPKEDAPPPPPPPPLEVKMEALPPAEIKQLVISAPTQPPPPPPAPPPPPPSAGPVDNIINRLDKLELSEQVTNPSPTGG
jgi:hypothetical protein